MSTSRRTSPEEEGSTVHDILAVDAAAWDTVGEGRRTPMQRYSWARACADALVPEGGLQVVIVGALASPRAIAPLGRLPRGRALSVLGSEDVWESVEVVCADTSAGEDLARALADLRQPLHLGHYPADSGFIAALRKVTRGRALVVAKPMSVRAMPTVTLSVDWRDPASQLSSRRGSDLRRMRRQAEQLGEVTFDIVTPDAEDLEPLLDEAFAVEERSWKGRSGTALAQDRRLGGFFRRYAELACADGVLRLCFLRIGGAAAAMQIALVQDERFWLFRIGYDEAYAKCSPGNLLIAETIRHSAERGLKSYEFLGKESAWTKVWTKDARSVVTLRVYPYNVPGLLELVRDGAGLVMRKIRRAERHAAKGPDG